MNILIKVILYDDFRLYEEEMWHQYQTDMVLYEEEMEFNRRRRNPHLLPPNPPVLNYFQPHVQIKTQVRCWKLFNVHTAVEKLAGCSYEFGFIFIVLWSADSEGIFRSSSQAATCLPHTVESSYCLFSMLNIEQGGCED